MERKSIRERPITVPVQFEGEVLTISFNRGAITPRFISRLQQTGDVDVPQVLADLLTDWDLTDDGKPVPITVEELANTPDDVLSEIIAAIMEVVRPNLVRPDAPTASPS